MGKPHKDGRARPKAPKPHYKAEERELWLGGVLVKEFHVRAEAQETILQSFQELGWKKKIDDPLPHIPGVDPKRRLHHAIRNLNRHQKRPLLHFFGDGTGTRVGWCDGETSLRQSYATSALDFICLR
jgi:hypothetical protein